MSSPHDIIYRRTKMYKFKSISSTINGVVKFQIMLGVGAIPTKRRLGQSEQTQNRNNLRNNLNDLRALEDKRIPVIKGKMTLAKTIIPRTRRPTLATSMKTSV